MKSKLLYPRYYNNLIAKNDYNVDSAKLKEYFPLDTVVSGMLKIYQILLGLKFTEIGIQQIVV